MIHPDTELRFVSEAIGFGVFATRFIPKGTITYAKDPLEIEIASEQFFSLPPAMQEAAGKYSYIDERGIRVLSWDHGKYVNHHCQCNTLSTGYGFEIALKDIQPGEEVTDDYGLFNLPADMPVVCGKPCRRVITPGDIHRFSRSWDRRVRQALRSVQSVPQPLWGLVPAETVLDLNAYLDGNAKYRSVSSLAFAGHGAEVNAA